VVPYAPTRIRTRPLHLIRALGARGHHVTLATLWSDAAERRALEALSSEVTGILTQPIGAMRSLWNCICAAPSGEPLQAHYSWSPSLSRLMGRSLGEQHFDVVHVEHLRGVRYGLSILDHLPRVTDHRIPVIWDSVDCISDLFRRAARRGPTAAVRWAARLELPRTERYEGTVTQRFDRVLTTSEADRQGLLALADKAGTARPDLARRVVVIPNGVDLDHFMPPTGPREAATLVISGKMSYHANVAAVVAFADEVLPRIVRDRPETQLVIVGQDPAPVVRALAERPGVTVTGTVADVRPFLQRATLAVAPIQYAVGVQNKVLEAMACATPVVATPAAVEALGVADGRELVVARDAEEMATRIVELLGQPDDRARIGTAGRRYVETHHDWRSIADRLSDLYRDAR
jgi:sugar transferase (PEP-CTERM/EpsH1 system associated)